MVSSNESLLSSGECKEHVIGAHSFVRWHSVLYKWQEDQILSVLLICLKVRARNVCR